jgi:FRG domain
MDNEIRARNWSHVQKLLFADSWDPRVRRFRSSYVFRGLSDKSFDLRTSLMRLGGPFGQLERHLIRNFRKYAHRSLVRSDDDWHWVTLAQRHGLPTRLLDWTYSPYVALHFATNNLAQTDCDSVIWCVNYVKAHELLPRRLRSLLRNEGSHIFNVELLGEYATRLSKFDRLVARGAKGPCILFLEPPSLDDRIVNQFAIFSVISSPVIQIDDWLAKHPKLWKRIVIPKKIKWEIRDKLDQSNVTERVLFPGLDGLSQWLARHYSPSQHKGGPTSA